jgi:phosphoglycolate phosphatase
MAVDSIIFDLDGALWDATEVLCSAWEEVLADYQQIAAPLDGPTLRRCLRLPAGEAGRVLFPGQGEAVRARIMREIAAMERHYLDRIGGRLYPSLIPTLTRLAKRLRLALVCGRWEGYIECFLDYYDLWNLFTGFACTGQAGMPYGEALVLLMREHTLRSPLYVGGTAGNGEAAHATGIPFVFARYGNGGAQRFDYVVDSPEELMALEPVASA